MQSVKNNGRRIVFVRHSSELWLLKVTHRPLFSEARAIDVVPYIGG